MATVSELQVAFLEMEMVMENRSPWVVTVFPDNDPRVDSVAWVVEDGDVPVIYMSDTLYGLYCASAGIKNENWRGSA